MNHMERARQAADTLNSQLSDLLDLADVPEGSKPEVTATRAMGDIYDVLAMIPRQGRTASFVFDEGPMIYVNPDRDIREWPTSNGRKASANNPRTAALSKTRKVIARGPILSRRVITAGLYAELVEESLVDEHELVEV